MVTSTRNPKVALKEQVRRSLPTVTLEQIRIASPCKADWASMTGDAKTRHCGQCDKAVHDLSAMTRAEAEALVSGGQGRYLCVKMWVRPDGKVLTQDCPVGLAKLRQRLVRAGALFGALLASLGSLVGCFPREVMGEVGVTPGGSSPATETGSRGPEVAPIRTTTGETGEVAPGEVGPGEVAPVDSVVAPEPDAPHVKMGRMYIAPEDR